MKASRFFINTLREDPSEAELISHKLMLRAGLIRQLAAGIFNWQPLGLRSVRKVENIVREEMNNAGAAEIVMPAVQPAELWKESERWTVYGPELLRLKDRHEREFCVGPTHEEVVTDLVRNNVTSWRQLPFNLYQIQTKFRDEIRPRHGVMRAREFVMKDAYSFDCDEKGALISYQAMREAYSKIFDRIGLEYCIVAADSGAIGGNKSEEFLVLANNGEAQIAQTKSGYVNNLDQVPCKEVSDGKRPTPGAKMEEIATPGVKSIEDLINFLDNPPPIERCVKTMIVMGANGMAAVLLPGDVNLNLAKASQHELIGAAARLAEPADVVAKIGASFGSLGPVNMPIPVIADYSLKNVHDFACGANQDEKHYLNVNFERDCPEPVFADLKLAKQGDLAPDGEEINVRYGIEVGHIFYLGTKYSTAMSANFENQDSETKPIEMGCYGIGITRIVAAAIEQNYDENGIVFPTAIAPFQLVILPLGKAEEVTQVAEKLYRELQDKNVDVLFDDRGLRPGPAFSDLDLIGIPHRVVISERNLKNKQLEYKFRASKDAQMINQDEAINKLLAIINQE